MSIDKMNKITEQYSSLRNDIKHDTKDYPIDVLISKYQAEEFYIPDYQRSAKLWDDDRMCRLIESIILGVPIPYIFFGGLEDGRFEIIDGVQRISSIERFMAGDLILKNMEKLTELNGLKYEDLPVVIKRKFNNTPLRVIVLDENTREEYRFLLFERINTGALEARPAETRRGSYPGTMMDLIIECANNEKFLRLCGGFIGKSIERRENEELVARYFTYVDNDNYKNAGHDVRGFIDEYIANNQNASKKYIDNLRQEFYRMLDFVDNTFSCGFRKTLKSKSTPKVRFEAIAIGTTLALRDTSDLHVENVEWIESEGFKKETTTHSSNNPGRLISRVEFVRDKLLGV